MGKKRKGGKTFKKQYVGRGCIEIYEGASRKRLRSKESLVKIMQWNKMWIGTMKVMNPCATDCNMTYGTFRIFHAI
ncbi:hypothetical protein H131_18877 [Lysinibacillus sphaericus OT4b.31]|uniref:Uncharacterized protein n=1 Tax=Lysinibacillus sphaericus OT4b.31 TaxID=1285586 RepID=R7ZAC1_LYSSH|nr:hypothetical protein H131_18877 [Lysinibacillus sphaericus OT4b.31]